MRLFATILLAVGLFAALVFAECDNPPECGPCGVLVDCHCFPKLDISDCCEEQEPIELSRIFSHFQNETLLSGCGQVVAIDDSCIPITGSNSTICDSSCVLVHTIDNVTVFRSWVQINNDPCCDPCPPDGTHNFNEIVDTEITDQQPEGPCECQEEGMA